MESSFFKNVNYMLLGTFFKFFIAFLSTAIYIRVIGLEGYAIIGIVFSLFLLLSRFNIPFFLALVKNNLVYHKEKKILFEPLFNTLYSAILISNIIFFLMLFPLIIFLSGRIYNDPGLLLYFIIALSIFLINRVNVFFKEFMRANKRETVIQKIAIPSLLVEFLSSLIFLLILKFGVISIFIAVLIKELMEYFLFLYSIKAIVKLKPYFSLDLFIKIFKKYALRNFLSRSSILSIPYVLIFISTFYLGTYSLGIITVIILLMNRLEDLFFPIGLQLAPLLSNALISNHNDKVKKIIKNITLLFLFLFVVSLSFFLTIGNNLYTLYFGQAMNGTYFLFIIAVSGLFLRISFLALETYIFVSNIKMENKISLTSAFFFLIMLFFMIKNFGIIGAVISYFTYYLLRATLVLSYSAKIFRLTKLYRKIPSLLVLAFVFIIANLLVLKYAIIFTPTLGIILFFTITFIIFALFTNDLIKSFKFIIQL